jgi:hypothetical protein
MSGTGFAKQRAGELVSQEIAALRQMVRGEVVAPGDFAYDQARRVWNGMIDRRPGPMMLLQPSSLRVRARCWSLCAPEVTTSAGLRCATAVSSSISRG